jgi:hypothetical protein
MERLLGLPFSGFLKGKPCPQNVPGGVYVGVGLVAASETSELRLGDAVSRSDVPAFGAPLGSMTGIDCGHVPSGAFSLGGQDSQEDAPPRVVNGLVQAGFGRRTVGLMPTASVRERLWPPGHVGDLEVLVDDQVIFADQSECRVVGMVEALSMDLAVQPSDPCGGFLSSTTPAFFAGEVLLGCRQPLTGGCKRARVGDVPAVAGRQE